MGGRFELESQFRAPAGVVSVNNRMIAGAYAALAISGRTPGYEELAETQAGEILNQRALNYLSRWNEADRELAGLTRVMTFRPLPSHVIVKNAIHVDYAPGESLIPLTFEWKGIQVDADLRPTAPVSVDSEFANQREFFLLSGLIGSELEGRILEQDLSLNAVSTVELMRLAASGGIEVREIDSSNVDTELALIDLEPELENAIAAHAHLGRTIRAPIAELTFLAWTGSGFTAWDPLTGESAYLLSGRIAGGSTADPPADFPPDLREDLETPTEPVSEPSRIVGSIELVDSSAFLMGVDVCVIAVALVRQKLHRGVLEVPHAEAENGEKDSAVPLVLDELLETSPTADANVEIAVGRENDAVDAAFDEAFGRDFIGELNALASRGGTTSPQSFDRAEYRSLIRFRGGLEHEPGRAGVNDDRDAVFGTELFGQKAHRRLEQRQLVGLRHRSGNIEKEHEVSRRQLVVRNPSALKTYVDETVRGLPRTRGHFGSQREWVLTVRLGIVVLEIVDELFGADGVLRRTLSHLEKASHVAVGRCVDVDREC